MVKKTYLLYVKEKLSLFFVNCKIVKFLLAFHRMILLPFL